MLAGGYPGDIYFFKGLGKGQFTSPKTIRDENGKVIKPASAVNVLAADMDGDGLLDLWIGSRMEGTWWVKNVGSKTGPRFSSKHLPIKTIKGEVIGEDHGDYYSDGARQTVNLDCTSIHYGDWDSDGKRDLVCGGENGSVTWYRNVGEDNAPKFAGGKVLIPGAELKEEEEPEGTTPRWHGGRVKVFVADYNLDRRMDILLGDYTSQSKKNRKLSAEQEAARDKIEKRLATVEKEMEQLEEQGEKFQAKIDKPPSKRYKIEEEIKELYCELDKYETNESVDHGWVWVYLSKPQKQ